VSIAVVENIIDIQVIELFGNSIEISIFISYIKIIIKYPIVRVDSIYFVKISSPLVYF